MSKKCILLVRVSTQSQDLEQQTIKVREQAIKDGFTDENIIVIEDKESAVKLSESERNGLNMMKHYIENDDVSTVYTYEVSRISRQPAMLYSIRDYLIEHHVQLIILNPFIKMLKEDDSLSESANIFFGIFASMAENEGFLRKQRTKRGKEKRRSEGFYIGCKIPFGYKVVNKRYVIDENDSETVRRIFNEYVTGYSMRKIARNLVDENRFRTNDYDTATAKCLHIIHNENYLGNHIYPKIIDKETFDKAQNKCSKQRIYLVERETDALCKGLVFNEIGHHLMATNNATRKYVNRRGTNQTNVYFDVIDNVVWETVVELNSIYSKYDKSDKITHFTNQIESCKRKIVKLRSDIDGFNEKLYHIEERYIEGKIPRERCDTLFNKLYENKNKCEQQITQLQDEILRCENMLRDLNENVVQDVQRLNLSERQALVRDYVHEILIERIARFRIKMSVSFKRIPQTRVYIINTRKFNVDDMQVIMQDALPK